MTFFSKFKRGLEGARRALQPCQFKAGDHTITCVQCGHDRFADNSALLNTSGLTFLGLDWADKSAQTLACERCGHVMWFVKSLEKLLNI